METANNLNGTALHASVDNQYYYEFDNCNRKKEISAWNAGKWSNKIYVRLLGEIAAHAYRRYAISLWNLQIFEGKAPVISYVTSKMWYMMDVLDSVFIPLNRSIVYLIPKWPHTHRNVFTSCLGALKSYSQDHGLWFHNSHNKVDGLKCYTLLPEWMMLKYNHWNVKYGSFLVLVKALLDQGTLQSQNVFQIVSEFIQVDHFPIVLKLEKECSYLSLFQCAFAPYILKKVKFSTILSVINERVRKYIYIYIFMMSQRVLSTEHLVFERSLCICKNYFDW